MAKKDTRKVKKEAPLSGGFSFSHSISLQDAIASIEKTSLSNQPDVKYRDSTEKAEVLKKKLELREHGDYITLRNTWSENVTNWITLILCSQIVIVTFVGLGVLDYKDYEWLIPMLLVKNLGEVIGLGYVMVRFLYPKKPNPLV